MIGKCQSAGTCNDRTECQFTKLILSFLKKICKGFLDICKMSLIVGEDKRIVSSKIAILTVVEPMSIPSVCFFIKIDFLLVVSIQGLPDSDISVRWELFLLIIKDF